MKKIISIILIAITLIPCSICLADCGDDCIICGGSGYYQNKYCPVCH